MQAHNATTNQTAAPHAEATIGAVIVAAGMSSRMGDFKPMMGIGAISIAQRIVATLLITSSSSLDLTPTCWKDI